MGQPNLGKRKGWMVRVPPPVDALALARAAGYRYVSRWCLDELCAAAGLPARFGPDIDPTLTLEPYASSASTLAPKDKEWMVRAPIADVPAIQAYVAAAGYGSSVGIWCADHICRLAGRPDLQSGAPQGGDANLLGA